MRRRCIFAFAFAETSARGAAHRERTLQVRTVPPSERLMPSIGVGHVPQDQCVLRVLTQAKEEVRVDELVEVEFADGGGKSTQRFNI
jgi:hypothetical protein